MNLDSVSAGAHYRLVVLNAPPKTRSKLETLGLVPGERISILSSTSAGLIIEVKNSRLALAHDLARSIEVA